MSFQSGSITLRMLHLPNQLPTDAIEAFAKKAAPSTIGVEAVSGWVGGRHLLDLPITEENAKLGGYLRLNLLQAERKVPTKVLQAECAIEEQAEMKASGKPFVDRKTRSKIRKNVIARLLPNIPPTLKGCQFVADERAGTIYSEAASDNQCDALCVQFLTTTGIPAFPMNCETIAATLGLKTTEWGKTSFAKDIPDEAMENTAAFDFLTWLWFVSETRGGLVQTKDGQIAITIEGPLTFGRDGEGAHQISLKDGLPTASAEAKTALLAGKKLEKAKLLIGKSADEIYAFGFDVANFVFRGLKLPEPKELLDPASAFQQRIQQLGNFKEIILELFRLFATERSNPTQWSQTQKEMQAWVADRSSKK